MKSKQYIYKLLKNRIVTEFKGGYFPKSVEEEIEKVNSERKVLKAEIALLEDILDLN